MGLFNFFGKKKSDQASSETPAAYSGLYLPISKYSEYIMKYVYMQQQGNYAPIAAYEKPNGELIGFLYVIGEDTSYSLSADEVIERMETRFKKNLSEGQIKSYVILYHSQFNNDNNHAVATSSNELNAISIVYNFYEGPSGITALKYSLEEGSVRYAGFNDLSNMETGQIMAAVPIEGKDYFQDREEIIAPSFENNIGLKITKSNCNNLTNTWSGIFGFKSYSEPAAAQRLKEYFALTMIQESVIKKGDLQVQQLDYKDIAFKAVVVDDIPEMLLPVVKTNYTIDFYSKEIAEWENLDNLEAIISGRGRDTFGVWYFATDYAENRDRYLSERNFNVQLSGIAFVLDLHNPEGFGDELKISSDFTMYMPNNDVPYNACFDFIGHLEDFRETSLLEKDALKGYMLKVRLITNEEKEDFFTIDMYATQENMRFAELTKGMKLTGMFQLQGRMAP